MAGANRRTVPPVVQGLLTQPTAYSFFQAVRMLRLWACGPGGGFDSPDEFYRSRLRIRPQLSLGFPATDMTDIGWQSLGEDDYRIHITTTFMGLYGTGSPLPTFYTEELLDEAGNDRTVSRDFLDIFNQDFYIHFFKAWSKYRLMFKVLEEGDADYIKRLYCLLGLGHRELRRAMPHHDRALRYIGLFSQFPRSALGLKTMLADLLAGPRLAGTQISETRDPGPRVAVRQCVLRWVSIPEDQRMILGERGCTLGEDCWLGERIQDRMGKIVIEVDDLSADKFHDLLPGETLYDQVESLTGFYLVDPVDHDLRLTVRPEEVQPVQPGAERWSRLGYDTWLFSGKLAGEAVVELPRVSRDYWKNRQSQGETTWLTSI